jgi:hypothetical protein
METADRWRKEVAACRSPNDMVRPPAENLPTTQWKYRVIGRRACKTSCPLRAGRLPIVPYDVHTGARPVGRHPVAVPSMTWPPLIRMSSITARRLPDSQDRFAPGGRQRRKLVSPTSTRPLDAAKHRSSAPRRRGIIGAHPLPPQGNEWLPDDFR